MIIAHWYCSFFLLLAPKSNNVGHFQSEKRSKIEIVYDILKTIYENKNIKKTHIIYKTNITHTRLKEYMEFLKGKSLVHTQKEGKKEKIIITSAGIEFMEEFKKLRTLSDAFGISL